MHAELPQLEVANGTPRRSVTYWPETLHIDRCLRGIMTHWPLAGSGAPGLKDEGPVLSPLAARSPAIPTLGTQT